MTKPIWESFRPPEDIRLARNSGNLETLQTLRVKYEALLEASGSKFLDGCLAVLNNTIAAIKQIARFNTVLLPESRVQGQKALISRSGTVIRWGDKQLKAAVKRQERLWAEGACFTEANFTDSYKKEALEVIGLTISTSDRGYVWLKEIKKGLFAELGPSLDQWYERVIDYANRTNPGRGSQGHDPKFPGLKEALDRYDRWMGLLETVKRYA